MSNTCCKSVIEGPGSTAASSCDRPALDVVELPGEFLVTLDVPGVSLQNIEVSLEKREMTVSARTTGDTPEGVRMLRHEFGSRNWRRTFTIGEDIDAEGATASMELGVLQIRLPKTAKSASRRIPVHTSTNT